MMDQRTISLFNNMSNAQLEQMLRIEQSKGPSADPAAMERLRTVLMSRTPQGIEAMRTQALESRLQGAPSTGPAPFMGEGNMMPQQAPPAAAPAASIAKIAPPASEMPMPPPFPTDVPGGIAAAPRRAPAASRGAARSVTLPPREELPLPPVPPSTAEEAPKKEAEGERRGLFGLSQDQGDLLTEFGLGLLASESPHFMKAVGQAGLSANKSYKEKQREKKEDRRVAAEEARRNAQLDLERDRNRILEKSVDNKQELGIMNAANKLEIAGMNAAVRAQAATTAGDRLAAQEAQAEARRLALTLKNPELTAAKEWEENYQKVQREILNNPLMGGEAGKKALNEWLTLNRRPVLSEITSKWPTLDAEQKSRAFELYPFLTALGYK